MRYVVLAIIISSLPVHALAADAVNAPVVIEGVRVGRTVEKSRVVFDMSGPVTYKVRKTESPPRYVVEFDGIEFDTIVDNKIFAGTPITVLKQRASHRISFELTDGNLEIVDFHLKPYQGRGYRLVFDFYTTKGIAEKRKDEIIITNDAPEKSVSVSVGTSTAPETEATVKVHVNNASSQITDTSSIDFGGTWEQEWAVASGGSSQKFEAVIEPRWDVQINDQLSFTGILRVRLDGVGDLGPDDNRPENYSNLNGPLFNNKYGELSLRELYFDYSSENFYWRLGKQQVVWGQADGLKVLDVVNPQSFREFILDDFDDSRIPLWMVNLEYSLGEASSLQVLWIPDTSYHEFAEEGSPYSITSPRLVPNLPPGTIGGIEKIDKPDDAFSDSDTGLRLTSFVGGWDLSINYLYHYQDMPVFYQDTQVTGLVSINPVYERNNLFGGTASNAFGPFTVRGELAYSTDTFHLSSDMSQRGILNSPELASVLGLDWQYSSDTFISAQWFYSQLLDYQKSTIRSETEQVVSLLYQSEFYNAAWQFRALALYSLSDEDSLVQLKLKYWLRSDLEVWLGLDIFSGEQNGLFGQFKEEDRFLLGMKYGF